MSAKSPCEENYAKLGRCDCWDCTVEHSEWLDMRDASGIETEGQDPTGLGAEHESPTAEGGAAQGASA